MNAVINKVERILTDYYSTENYVNLMKEILSDMEEVAPDRFVHEYSNFSSHIDGYTHVGTYICPENAKIIVMSVKLKKQTFVENSRSTQRSYAKKLMGAINADAALVAFHTPDDRLWRLSFVRLDYEMRIEKGRSKVTETLTPARRYSFLVGKDEPCHTAVERFRLFLDNHVSNPTLDELEEAFGIEAVTRAFFEQYKEKFLQIRDHLEKNDTFLEEAKLRNYTSAQFSKKLMGQIVFLYFLQKKGWLGVSAWPRSMSVAEYKQAYFSRGARSRELIPQLYQKVDENTYQRNTAALSKLSDEEEIFLSTCVRGEPWGTGPKNFMRKLFEESTKKSANFFEDYLEPLFYDALNVNRGERGYDPALHCRIPFLSGGLFEPLDGYEWKHNNFNIPNELFSNQVKKDDRLADGILDIFDRYNFTMCEDEPLEREVAIDPEMLGKVFENLLEVNDRKSKGAFYTPREIVHYMCQESLIQYLTASMAVGEATIRDFILYGDFIRDEDASVLKRAEKGDSYDLWISDELYLLDKDGRITVDRMAELDKALQDVRVADPAVGSGAFPLGMLNEIVRARQNITTYLDITQKIRDPKGAPQEIRYRRINERSPHRLKYETIRNCIYAVDIEPSAVDITQLRLWLALVIDDEINPTAASQLEGHRNPLPLPNLECNILCGNSLIDSFEGIKLINQSELLGNTETGSQFDFYQSSFEATLERLILRQEELYHCDSAEKKGLLLEEIEELRNNIILTQAEGVHADFLEKYEETKHSASKPYTLWELDFARVFREKGGFDIVIGNPPYIQLQKCINEGSNEKLGDLYSSYGFKTYAKTGDIYCLFYEKGTMLLHSGGILSYITSNKWMRAAYGQSLRRFLAQNTNPIYLIDFAGTKVFLSATVDVNILIVKKEENEGRTKACIVKDKCFNNLSVYTAQGSTNSSFFNEESWVILSSIEQRIRNKVEATGKRLRDWNVSINYGIKTGLNEAFILTGDKRSKIIAEDPKSAEIIRPILRGRDIKRYGFDFQNLYVIFAYYGSNKIIPEKYPVIYQHLMKYEKRLRERGQCRYTSNGRPNETADYPGQHHWLELDNNPRIDHMDDFSKQKIVYREICDAMDACLITEDYSINNKCYMITGDSLIFLLSFFNSKLFNKIIFKKANVTGGKGEAFVSSIKVPIPSREMEEELERLYHSRARAGKNELIVIENRIDRMICSLYGLSDEETAYIQSK